MQSFNIFRSFPFMHSFCLYISRCLKTLKRKRVSVRSRRYKLLFIVYSCERKRVSVELVELWKIPDYGWPCMLLLVLKFVRKNTSHEKDCLQSRLFEVARHFKIDWIKKSWRAEPGVTRQITLSGFIPSAIFSVKRLHHSIVHSLLNHSILSTLYLLNWAWRVSKYWMLFG